MRVDAVLWNIRVDAATAEVVVALREAGIDSVVLKGPALTDWYPADSTRTYVDGDVWVSPSDGEQAEATLAGLGFVAKVDESGMPDWWQEHASSWRREVDAVSIDLHRKLQGFGAVPARVWARLWPDCEPMQLAGREVMRLSEPARVLYATIHTAHHGVQNSLAQRHLNAALRSVNEPAWRAATGLAWELDATEMFGAGLRLVPEGARLADVLGLPASQSVQTALLAMSPPPVALGFEQLANASLSDRARIVLRKVVPPRGFVRHWWPPAARSGWMLVAGYAYRPIWLLLRAPAGYRAWRSARRDVARQRRDASNSR